MVVKRNPNTFCDECGKPIYRTPAELKRNKSKTCSRDCQSKNLSRNRFRENNPHWKGGTYLHKGQNGYLARMVRCPEEFDETARSNGYVMKSRLVMAKHLGRSLTRQEVVHHEDDNPDNNNLYNLKLFQTNGEHKAYESLIR